MKVTLSWLSELIESKQSISAQVAQQAFTQLGFEVESVTNIGEGLTGPIIIGQVIQIEELTEYKKPIRYCQVKIGKDSNDVIGIVCGASNFDASDKVVVALPGSMLPGNFSISMRETYGKTSEGMICSLKELGIADEHSGILVVDSEFEIGSDAVDALRLKDTVFDLSILPDRGYALSVRGLARELAMHIEAKFLDPISRGINIEGVNRQLELGEIVAKDACTKLILTKITDVNVQAKTPWEMKRRLLLSGMRSISLPVDITNYVMIELGQPLHAFDADRLTGKIQIRYADEGETLQTLDHTDRQLSTRDLVVADDKRALSLAGLMGGTDSEIGDNSKNMILEAAHFVAHQVSESARRHNLTSEAGRRFQRGVDPNLPKDTALYAASLFVAHAGGRVQGSFVSENPTSAREVNLDLDLLETITGLTLTKNEIVNVLEKIGCSVVSLEPYKVLIPSWRPDIVDSNCIAEEILRVIGYDLIPNVSPPVAKGYGLTKNQKLLNDLRSFLASSKFTEVLTYPFISAEKNAEFAQLSQDHLVKIANPLSDEQPYLRSSLLPGLFETLSRNFNRGNTNLSIFEIGSVYFQEIVQDISRVEFPINKNVLVSTDKALPDQPKMLGGLIIGSKSENFFSSSESWAWPDAIRVVTELLNLANIDYKIRTTNKLGFHPGRCAEFLVEDLELGVAGEVHPNIGDKYSFVHRVSGFELNLSAVYKVANDLVLARPIVNYPVAKEDLAILIDLDLPSADLVKSVKNLGISELEAVDLFDIYLGDQVPKGKKSVALAFRFRAADRTLTSEEVAALKAQILHSLEQLFGATIRS